MSLNCLNITPGQPLNSWQIFGLELVSLFRGRDVVIAIDLTESVGLNDEGRIRLRQIVADSLQRGDRVYVIPFATEVDSPQSVIKFRGKQDIDQVLSAVPLEMEEGLRNTDIQRAEGFVYEELAIINQCRLLENQTVLPQSVVWLTDAPLLTTAGINSETWIETPADSPFRVADSVESQQRWSWIEALPLSARSRSIITADNREYQLTVVDIKATVQEFCTPAPGGKETCLVTPYLIQQLWLPGLILGMGVMGSAIALQKFVSWRKKWKLVISSDHTTEEEQICYLKHKQKIAIGDVDPHCIDTIPCPGSEVRAYIERSGNKLFLLPTGLEEVYYNGQEVRTKTLLPSYSFRINCPDPSKANREFEIFINIKK